MKSIAFLLLVALLTIGCDQGTTPLDSQNLPTNLPPGPSMVEAEIISPTAARITWTDSTSEAREYELLAQWGEDPAFHPIQRVNGSKRELVWDGCDRPTGYQVKIRSVLGTGYSEATKTKTFIRTRRVYAQPITDIDWWSTLDVQLSPDGEQLLLCETWSVQLRETVTGKVCWTNKDLTAATFLPDGGGIIAAKEKELWRVSPENGALVERIGETGGRIVQILVTKDNKWIFTKNYYNWIEAREVDGNHIKTLGRGDPIDEIEPYYPSGRKLVVSPRNDLLAIIPSEAGGIIEVMQIGSFNVVTSFDGRSAQFSPDGSKLAITGVGTSGKIVSTKDWGELLKFDASGNVIWSPEGKYLVVGTWDIHFINSTSGEDVTFNLEAFKPYQRDGAVGYEINHLVFSRDSRYLVGISSNSSLSGTTFLSLWI